MRKYLYLILLIIVPMMSSCYFDIDNYGYPRNLKVSAEGGEMVINGDTPYNFEIYDKWGNHSYGSTDIGYVTNPDYDPSDPESEEIIVVEIYDNRLDWLEIVSTEPLTIKVEKNTTGHSRKLFLIGTDFWDFGDRPEITITQSK